jgi:hypothetical protein
MKTIEHHDARGPEETVHDLSPRLGLEEVPVIVLDHLSEAQKRAYIIADNQLALNAGWNDDLLREELAALQDESFDVSLLGFEDEELAQLLAAQDASEGLTDEDAVPELPQTPVSVTGDLWILGEHKLLVGDATKPADVATLMGGDYAPRCTSATHRRGNGNFRMRPKAEPTSAWRI